MLSLVRLDVTLNMPLYNEKKKWFADLDDDYNFISHLHVCAYPDNKI